MVNGLLGLGFDDLSVPSIIARKGPRFKFFFYVFWTWSWAWENNFWRWWQLRPKRNAFHHYAITVSSHFLDIWKSYLVWQEDYISLTPISSYLHWFCPWKLVTSPYYMIGLTQITVGSSSSKLELSAIFDSGTSLTILSDPAYTFITESVSILHKVFPDIIGNTC